ncbi:ABC transporter substrate-binding protein [Paraglaciecola sp. L3A3]|uniref:substrate-binding periplasmic protein n=1 Tax=Paraglaciecola sp. L3A3 TaxID=2686358 RepID=UPI00131ACD56|nr:transporter substrate-binding domain-containing protein [Paraglaciecola sp. L3A3]
MSIGISHFPPYSSLINGVASGAEVEIVEQSFSMMNYQVKFVNYPFGRLPSVLSSEKVDGIIVTLKTIPQKIIFYSEIVLPEYQTVAIHLKKNNLSISAMKDLAGKSILAHQQASQFYGDEYRGIADAGSENLEYSETVRQGSQVLMLLKDRVDVIVLALEIYHYYQSGLESKYTENEVVVSKIFGGKFGFHNAFLDKKVRDDFEQGLARIKENGQYSKILEKYLKYYQPIAN